ncbi:hypothetical protein F5Y16DRAFT_421221 [Xylariaceae sp. FL0255]|nr:hypothetical protein F5Y16DRAFT_421221 [Xylariaceae sp. FL0255]
MKLECLPLTSLLSLRSAAAVSRPLIRYGDCDPLPLGSGPTISPNTPSAFVNATIFSDILSGAPTPAGYHLTYQNRQATSKAYGYGGFQALTTGPGCSGFNIYFERSPSLRPAALYPNPNSTTTIKCVFWGGYLGDENNLNTGFTNHNFQYVVAGSNAYMKTTAVQVPGFTGAAIGNHTINAPLNCLGEDRFMGARMFSSSYYDPNLCATACASQNDYNKQHPPSSGEPQICVFFASYLVAINGQPQGQYCALYSGSWNATYATHDVQYRGNDRYTNTYGFIYTDNNYTGNPTCP